MAIKNFSRQSKAVDLILKKKQVKENKMDRGDCFSRWKALIYRRKLFKVSFSVILKNYQRRQKINKEKYFMRWKKINRAMLKQEEALLQIVLNKQHKNRVLGDYSLKRAFRRWRDKLRREESIKNQLLEAVNKIECNEKGKYFFRWLNSVAEIVRQENKLHEATELLEALSLERNFHKLK